MSRSLTFGGGENVPDIPSACATRNFTYLARGPWWGTCRVVSVMLERVRWACIQYVTWNMHTIDMHYLPIFFRVVSLALRDSCDCPSASDLRVKSILHKTSDHKISLSLEVARSDVKCSNRFEIWQVTRQHCCLGAYHIPEQLIKLLSTNAHLRVFTGSCGKTAVRNKQCA